SQIGDTRYKELNDKIALIPFWLPIFLAAIGTAISVWTFMRSFTTRAEDLTRADNFRRDDLAQAALRRREDLARVLANQWKEHQTQAGHVRFVLTNPETLNNPATREWYRLLLTTLGNWFEVLATEWKNQSADHAVLRRASLPQLAAQFWAQFQNAKTALADDQDAGTYLKNLEPQWSDLSELITRGE